MALLRRRSAPRISKLAQSQRSRTKASSTSPSVTMTCASALTTATLVPGRQRQMIVGLDMRRACTRSMRRGSTTISFAPCAQPLLHARGEDGMRVGRIGADDEDDVGLVDGFEKLRPPTCRTSSCPGLAGRRMANARAGVDIVVAERRAHQLLHEVHFFVGAARRRDGAEDSRPYLAWMRRNSVAAWPIASSHDTSRHGSVIFARIIGLVMRSLCVA